MKISWFVTAILCTGLVSGCITPRSFERTAGVPPPETINDTYNRVSQNPLNTVMDLPETTRVVVETDDAIYLFTKPSHPAHPSYLYTRNIKKPQGWYRITTGYSENHSDEFESWLSQHRKNDGLLKSR